MGKPSSGQMQEFWNQVGAGRINGANFQRFLDTPDWQQSQLDEETKASPVYMVTVDNNLTLHAMIEPGKYGWVNEKITPKNFKLIGEGKVETEVELVHLNQYPTTKQVEAELEKRGLRATTIEELLALGAQHPELQRKFPIVALGSRCVLYGYEFVPVLCGDGDLRVLGLHCSHDRWHSDYRFAAVRKPARPAGG